VTALIIRGNALALPLSDESVDLICTSPPYFGLRSYTDGGQHYPGQLGSEATPAEFVDALLAATREMMRVLKPTGSAFINLGDKYATAAPGSLGVTGSKTAYARNGYRSSIGLGIREKSLIGVPWRYALACIDQLGLILRAEIVLDKRNGLPESVTDRVRRSHEQAFHFTKQPRYYSAVDEIREPHQPQSLARTQRNRFAPDLSQLGIGPPNTLDPTEACNPLGKLPGSVWEYVSEPLRVPDHLGVDHYASFALALPRRIIRGWSPPGICVECSEGRRPVVNVRYAVENRGIPGGTAIAGRHRQPTFGSGAEWNITGYACACTPYTDHPERRGTSWNNHGDEDAEKGSFPNHREDRLPVREYHFERWTPAPSRPSVVLDPFSGAGTTALVASMLGRIGIGVDLSHDYCRLGVWRTTDPGERARALQVPKPPPVPQGQSAFDFEDVS